MKEKVQFIPLIVVPSVVVVALALYVLVTPVDSSSSPIPLATSAQFINQILRPCVSGATPFAKVEANPGGVAGNVAITTCVGGVTTINGVPISGGGSGTVTSVGLALPASMFSVNGSPVTTSGTLTGTFTTQLANRFFAGPASGGAATPTFRVINTADLGTGTANNTTFLRGDLTWQTISGGSGITTLNGLSGASQSFATGASGSDFNIVSATTVHTFNIPDASVTARGVVTTGTQTFGGAKTFNSTVDFTGSLVNLANSLVLWTGTDIEYRNSGYVAFRDGGAQFLHAFASGQFRAAANAGFMFTSGNNDPIGTIDTGISRNAAAVVEINNGTPGTFGDLKLRNLNATGSLLVNGNTIYSAGTPAASGGTLDAASRNSAGRVTTATTGVSTITVTFSVAFQHAPACTASNETTANLARAAATTTVLTITGTTATGDVLSYICLGY